MNNREADRQAETAMHHQNWCSKHPTEFKYRSHSEAVTKVPFGRPVRAESPPEFPSNLYLVINRVFTTSGRNKPETFSQGEKAQIGVPAEMPLLPQELSAGCGEHLI